MRAAEGADMLYYSPINLLTEVLANNCLFTHPDMRQLQQLDVCPPYSKCPISSPQLTFIFTLVKSDISPFPVCSVNAAHAALTKLSVSHLTVCQVSERITGTMQSLKGRMTEVCSLKGCPWTDTRTPNILFCHTWDKMDGFHTFILSSSARSFSDWRYPGRVQIQSQTVELCSAVGRDGRWD